MNRGGVACAVARRSYKGVVCVRVRGHRDDDADVDVDGAELWLARWRPRASWAHRRLVVAWGV